MNGRKWSAVREPKRPQLSAFRALILLVIVLAGCGPSSPPVYTVKGTVTFEGAPVEEGDILFRPETTSLRAEGAKIIKGEYTVKAHPGKNKISISASKVNPALKSPEGEPVREDYIPAQYNFATTLQEEVATNNDNRFDFNLKAKAK